mgnify:CR=1 FL=1
MCDDGKLEKFQQGVEKKLDLKFIPDSAKPMALRRSTIQPSRKYSTRELRSALDKTKSQKLISRKLFNYY